MYDITSASQPNLNNRSFYVGIGNVVGGSSRVNGQVMMRGSAEDFELWADLIEDPSWGWDGMLPYFLKGTYFTPPREDMARAFNITYDPAVRGQMSGTRVYEEVSVPFLADISKCHCLTAPHCIKIQDLSVISVIDILGPWRARKKKPSTTPYVRCPTCPFL